MAYGTQQSLDIPGLLAGASLTTKQFHAVKLAATAGEVVCVTASTDDAIGILQNNPADGEVAEVRFLGVSKMAMAATVALAADLGWNTTGQGSARSGATSKAFGRVVDASTTAADLSTVLLTGFWQG